jgi:hypothetical protein
MRSVALALLDEVANVHATRKLGPAIRRSLQNHVWHRVEDGLLVWQWVDEHDNGLDKTGLENNREDSK